MKTENHINVGEMKKRRVLMADERRYLIYYTFDSSENTSLDEKSKTETPAKKGDDENV